MNRSMMIRRGLVGGIAGAGLALGGLGVASATAGTSDGASDSASAPADGSAEDASTEERGDRKRGHGRGPGGGHGGGGAALAEALGVTETELQTAFESLHEQRDTTDRSAPPTDDELGERREEQVDALAAELDLSPTDVSAAFEALEQDRVDERRTALADRLDEAVSAGDLTAADRTSVLKAFDTGVLDRDRAGHPGPR